MPRPAPRHTSGPIPYGFDLDAERFLIPSTRAAGSDGSSEHEQAAAIFERIAAGANPYAEAKRLNAFGVMAPVRYAGQETPARLAGWRPTRVAQMVRNPIYRDLVGDDVFTQANAVLDRRRVGLRPSRPYPLTGLVVCGVCGSPYVAQTQHWRGWPGGVRRYYACAAARSPAAYTQRRCAARAIPADWLEGTAAELASGARIRRICIDQEQRGASRAALVEVVTEDGRAARLRYPYSPRRSAGAGRAGRTHRITLGKPSTR